MEKRGLIKNSHALAFRKKRGQVTVFIIIGVILVGAAMFFLITKSKIPIFSKGGGEVNANAFLESCLEQPVRNSLNLIMLQGGSAKPKFYKRFKFGDENYYNISYLCYQQNFYIPCINQEPVLSEHIKKEIKNYIKEDVNNCFDELESNLKKDWSSVDIQRGDYNINFNSKNLIITFNSEIKLSNKKTSIELNNLKVLIPTKIQSIILVVDEILNQESKYCNFNKLGYMLTYPEWEIGKFETESPEEAKIYSVKNIKTGEKFRFAVRSCALPPGY